MTDHLAGLFGSAVGMLPTSPARSLELFSEITSADETACDAWVGRIQAGSDRIARGLPVGFTHTAQALDYLQPLDWLRAGERQAVPGPTGCMARKMAASRRRGQDYQSALTQAVAGCPSAP